MRKVISRLTVLLAAGLSACGEAEDPPLAGLGDAPIHPVLGCEGIDHRSCDVRDAACQERLLELTACIRGEETPPMPPVTVMTEAEFSAYLYSTLDEEEMDLEVNHLEHALVMLGLVESNALDVDVVVADLVKSIGGVYRDDSDDVIVVDHGTPNDQDMAANVLVHEFVHYLQDRQVDLSAFDDAIASTSDALMAGSSVVEGEAELHQIRHYASLLGLDPNTVDYGERFEAMVGWSERYLLEHPSPFTQIRGVFPYSWGGRFMERSWASGGREAVTELFASPPAQTRTLMVGSGSALPEDVEAVTLASPETAQGWSLYSEDVGGAFLLFLYLATQTTLDEARSLSLAWRGDTLSIFARDEGTPDTIVAWRLAFEDATVRDRVLALSDHPSTRHVAEGAAGLVIAGSYYGESLTWVLTPPP